MQDDVVALFAYDRWANTKVFDACRKLTAEQYVAEPVPGWSSVRSTICHIALATEFNLRTLASDPDDRIPTEADLATVDDVAQLLNAPTAALRMRPTLTPERLNTVLTLRDRPHFHPAAVGDTAPHCQSLQLPPRSDRLQAQTVRDRTIDHGLLLVDDRADSAREVNGSMTHGRQTTQGLLERSGFVREGCLRSYRVCRGQPHDFYIYGLLRSDWVAAQQQVETASMP